MVDCKFLLKFLPPSTIEAMCSASGHGDFMKYFSVNLLKLKWRWNSARLKLNCHPLKTGMINLNQVNRGDILVVIESYCTCFHRLIESREYSRWKKNKQQVWEKSKCNATTKWLLDEKIARISWESSHNCHIQNHYGKTFHVFSVDSSHALSKSCQLRVVEIKGRHECFTVTAQCHCYVIYTPWH